MTITRRRTLPPRALAWVLWLAMLLPLAQLSAGGHGLKHALDGESDFSKQAVHLVQCGHCLAAAALGYIATPPVVAPPLPPALQQAPPLPGAHAAGCAAATLAYRSRAPPLA